MAVIAKKTHGVPTLSLAEFVAADPKTVRDQEQHEQDMQAARYRFYHRLSCIEIGKILGCSRFVAHRRVQRAEASGDPRIQEWQDQWDG